MKCLAFFSRSLIRTLSMAAVAVLASGAWAASIDIHGVKVEDSAELRGSKLQLNGAGTRFKGPFKVYVAGLYLGKRAVTLDEVVAQPGPKRMSVTMVRDIDAAELGKLLTRGVEDNVPKSELASLVPGLIRMGQVFSDQKKLATGDSFQFDWVPGVGSVLTVRGKVVGEPFKEPEFFKAVMALWLGPVPGDFKLKDALLGAK